MADEFARAGADLTLLARSADELAAIADRIGAKYIVIDITDPAARSTALAQIEAAGPVDVWINNAGIETHGLFVEHDPEEITKLFAVNLEAPVQFCRAVLPSMIERGSGHIVNVSSLAMAVTTPRFATYGASKAGLSAFAESLRVELDGTGVGLTTVEIGVANTDMVDDLRSDDGFDEMYRLYEKLKLQRLVEPGEVAVAVRAAVENNKPFVRIPKRAAGAPAVVNLPRAVSNLLHRVGAARRS